ncbi:MAG: hypothetical protein AUI10_03130 [Actinobacteria bacterium 13_2_20CM_2_72_6]|nr:MAG: hypothetical protein AUI10_03130 [Actinobacteria bacterium 13_2_20CM_2_72_6]
MTWHGRRDVRVENVPDPAIQDPDDIVIRVTSSGICGSDLHLYEVLGPFMTEGDILGHEPMGIVEEVGPAITNLRTGDRVVIPFMAGKDKVVAGSTKNKVQAAAARVMPDEAKARMHGKMSEPGSGTK